MHEPGAIELAKQAVDLHLDQFAVEVRRESRRLTRPVLAGAAAPAVLVRRREGGELVSALFHTVLIAQMRG
jgi:hypothetical protein